MECSTNVFDTSGIQVIGDALPGLSPIKADPEKSKHCFQNMDVDNGMLCVSETAFFLDIGHKKRGESNYVLCKSHEVSPLMFLLGARSGNNNNETLE